MTTPKISSRFSVVMAIIAITVAAIAAFGLVMSEDPVGRAVFAMVWVVIGLAWLGHVLKRKNTSNT